jgi:hypothetical protein
MDLQAFPGSHHASHHLVDDGYAAVDAYPGKYCRFAVVSFRAAAEFALLPGERGKLRQFLKFGLLEPASGHCTAQRWVAGNAPGQFCRHFR